MAVLEARHLSKRYGRLEALADLSISVGAGEIYGFLGRNGAGKSTAIRIFMGITKATSGEVSLFGERVTPSNHVSLRTRVGYVAQDQTFYGWMTPLGLGRFVRGFYPQWDQGEFERLLRVLDLPPKRRVGGFSGGMKMKLALVLALAHHPELLLLDEPTAGLDPVARREFLELVRDRTRSEGCTTLFSTHLIDEIEIAAVKVGIVHEGRALYEGSVSELRESTRLLELSQPNMPLPPALGQVPGLRLLRVRATPSSTRALLWCDDPAAFLTLPAPGWSVQRLPLEELFVELVRKAQE